MADHFVYFDESGQTYYNYLDPVQTHLAYGGLHTTDAEATTLKGKYFSKIQADELHYVKLSKTGVGQGAIKNFFQTESDWIAEHFKWFLIDKRYGLLAKYVDLLIEPEIADLGENLYSGGGSQKLVFLLHHSAKATENEESLSKLMTTFNAYYRTPSTETLAELERTAHSTTVGMKDLDTLLTMPFVRSGSKLLKLSEPAHLDLSFTAAFTVAHFWYKKLGLPYFLIHDESTVLSGQNAVWTNMTQETVGYEFEPVGPHEVATNVPLKSTIFVSSDNCVPLQLVDVLTGAHKALMQWILAGRPENPFLKDLEGMFQIVLPEGSILPINDPNDLPSDNQTVDELNEAFANIARRRATSS